MFSNWYNWFAWFFGWIRLKVPMQQRTKLSLRSQCLRCMIRMKEMKMRNGIMGENAYWLCLDILDVGSMFFWLYINILKRIRVWLWLIDGNHRPILINWDFGFGACKNVLYILSLTSPYRSGMILHFHASCSVFNVLTVVGIHVGDGFHAFMILFLVGYSLMHLALWLFFRRNFILNLDFLAYAFGIREVRELSLSTYDER
jgi:hypothetical protein